MTININDVKTDCIEYLGYKPCAPHKDHGVWCTDCSYYRKIEQRILIIKLDAVGDVLRTTALIPGFLRQYPNAHITWITRRNASDLLRYNERIHRVLIYEDDALQFVMNERFTAVLNLDMSAQSGSLAALARGDVKFGFTVNGSGNIIPVDEKAHQWYVMGINDEAKRSNRLSYTRLMYDMAGLPYHNDRPELVIPSSYRKETANKYSGQLDPAKTTVLINLGGGKRWQYKKWIDSNFVELLERLCVRTDINIIVAGGIEEKDLYSQLVARFEGHIIAGGCDNSLLQFGSVIDLADIVFTSDSLAMHLALSLGKTTIVYVGPTSPWELDVFGNGEVIVSSLDCIGCYLSVCDKPVNCMNVLTPDHMYDRIVHFIER